MTAKRGDVALLQDPVAQALLKSTVPARFAYNWKDGSPRVVPIWFHWNGTEVVICSPPNAPKVKALSDGAKVALTIDTTDWPHKVLLIRGTVKCEEVEGVAEEYAACAVRYFGEEGGNNWVKQVGQMSDSQVRFKITPTWVSILDFETRFPVAIEEAMAAGD